MYGDYISLCYLVVTAAVNDTQNEGTDPAIGHLEAFLVKLLEASDQTGLAHFRINPKHIHPLMAAVQNPSAWLAWSSDLEILDGLLAEIAAADSQDAWASTNGSRITRLHPPTARNLLLAVDSWLPEAEAVLREMEPVWQLARWLALPNEEREAAPRPALRRLPAEGTRAIFALRLDLATTATHAPTLQEVAELVGVTRERIRQVLVRCDEMVKPFRPQIERFRRWLRSAGLLLPVSMLGLPSEPRLLWTVATLLDQWQIDIDPVRQTISGFSKDEVEQFLEELVANARQGRFGSPLVDPTELRAWLHQVTAFRSWSPIGLELILSRISEKYLHDAKGHRIWRGTTRTEQLEYILAQYPKGFALYKASDKLADMLAELFGEEGRIGHSLATQASTYSSLIHLWGHGIYIHQRFIPPGSPLLEEIVDWLEDRFASDFEEVSILAAWEEFSDRCEATGIPTPAALYSWVRLNAKNRVNAPRYPTVLAADTSQRLSRTEIVREYLRSEGPVSFEQPTTYFSTTRAWSNQATLNVMHNMLDLYRGDDGLCYLTEWLPRRHCVVELLAPEVEAALAHAPLFSLLTLYRRHRDALHAVSIAGPRTLWGVLREGLWNSWRFGKYPLITHQASVGEANARAATGSIVKSHGAPIARSVIDGLLESEYGIEPRGFSLPQISDEIILYRGHPANLYIHRDWLEWNGEKQAQMDDRINAVLCELKAADQPIGYLEGLLLSPDGLPTLGHDLTWTRELLLEFLRPREDVLLLGTRRRLLMPAENALGIETDVDLAGYILAQQFGRRALFSAWEQALIRLDFCKQFPAAYRQDPTAAFVITGNEVELRPAGERWLSSAPRVLLWQGAATVPVSAVNPELVATPEVDDLLASLFGED